VNALDLVIVLVALAAVVGGYHRGFVARVASWVGMGVGLYVGARLIPRVADAMEGSAELTVFTVCAAVLVAGVFLGQAVGLVIGSRLRLSVGDGTARRTDQAFGAVAGLVAVGVVLWLLLPAIASVPSWPAEQARTSVLAGVIHDQLPEPPDALETLSSLVGEDRFPDVFAELERAPDVGPPPAATGMSAETAESVRRSTVKVLGEACGRLQEGSGFVVGPDRIATNAHVVAGTTTLAVERSDGGQLAARVVFFDPDTDRAVLAVAGLERPALPIGQPAVDDRGGVFGHPGGGELEISPFRVARITEALGRDIYDDQPVQREVLFLASDLAPGDSGSALVDPAGEVVGVAFAIAPDRDSVAYALSADELLGATAAAGSSPVATGPCI
jgi:uncharacterized membrane protein required for colicin V production